jgi:hypothetical protein
MTSALNTIATNFRETVDVLTVRYNLELREKLRVLLTRGGFGNDTHIAAEALGIVTAELMRRADGVTTALTEEITAQKSELSAGQALTLTTIHQQCLVTSIRQALNELYGRYEPEWPKGDMDNGVVRSLLADGLAQAEGAAFGAANLTLKTFFRRAGLDPEIAAPAVTKEGASPEMSVFVDTNCFIHLRDLKDLPWRKILKGIKWVEICVPMVVVEELDKHKTDRDDRLRKRSILALDLIDNATEAEEGYLLLRSAEPKITLRVFQTSNLDAQTATGLDLRVNDNRLVAAFVEASWQSPSKLMTCDRGPRITARHLKGPDCVIKPPQDWFLPPPPQSEETIELQREVARFKAQRPEIRFDIEAQLKRPNPLLPPLPEVAIEHLTSTLLARSPKHDVKGPDPKLAAMGLLPPNMPSWGEVDLYNKKFSDFTREVRDYFAGLHARLAEHARFQTIDISIENPSPHTAANLLLEFSLNGDGALFARRKDAEDLFGSVAPPTPPEPPKPKALFPNPNWDIAKTAAQLHTPRDPTGFFWQDRPKGSDKAGSLICAEFRARETYETAIYAALFARGPGQYRIDLKASATNLTSPVQAEISVEVAEVEMDWSDEAVQALLPDDVFELVQEALRQVTAKPGED